MFCDEKPVDYRIMSDENSDELPHSAFELDAGPGTECTLRVVAANTSSRNIHLDNVEFPAMGPESSPMLKAVRLMETGRGPQEIEDMSDAKFGVDVDLEPHSTMILQIGLAYGADSIPCRSENYTETRYDLPVVNVSALGRSRSVAGDVVLVVHGKGPEKRSC